MAAKIRRSFQIFVLALVILMQTCIYLVAAPKQQQRTEYADIGSQPARITSDGTAPLLHPGAVKQHFSVKELYSVRQNSKNVSVTGATDGRQLFHPVNATYHSPSFVRPKFSQIVKDHRNNVIVGDVQFLLDFAIIGHAKCGTSTMMEWLGLHPQVECGQGEMPHLALGKIGLFCKRMYNGFDASPSKLRAYKNPTDVQNLRAIRLLRDYFPQSRLLIGIRHPIRWFESFYNHRIQNTGGMPSADRLGGGCIKGSQGVCGSRGDFHLSLVRLGKTDWTLEQDAFSTREWAGVQKDAPPSSTNPVFLFDTQQLADQDPTRRLQFRRDMQDFLGLATPLDEVVHYSPGKKLENETLQAERNAKKLVICEDQHANLRKQLLEKAQRSANYIRTYFLNAPDVMVSSPDYFLKIMDSYMKDPCDEQQDRTDGKEKI